MLMSSLKPTKDKHNPRKVSIRQIYSWGED